MKGAEDVGRIAAGDAPKNVGGGQRGVVQKVGDVAGGDAEFAEAVKEIRPAAGARAAGDVIDVAALRNARVESRRSDGRRYLAKPVSGTNGWISQQASSAVERCGRSMWKHRTLTIEALLVTRLSTWPLLGPTAGGPVPYTLL